MKGFRFWRRKDGEGTGPAEGPGGSGLLTGDPKQDAHSLEILLETIAEVSANIDLDQVLEDIVDRNLQVTQAERAILFFGATFEDLEIRVARDKEGGDLGRDLQYSRGVVRSCMEQGLPVKSVVQSDQEALELGKSVYDLKLRAVMCAPLSARDRTLGAIYVDSRAVRREFSSRDLALFGALSAQLAISIENARLYADSLAKVRLEKDVEIARRIQAHLLPPIPRDLRGVDLALRYRAAEQASGDTYDILPLPDGRLAALIGDVTGHGVGAALLTHAAQAAIRSYLELLSDMSEVVTRLNHRLVSAVETGNFMSLLLVVLDAERRSLQYVNAGHPGLVLCSGDGVVQLEKTGMVLGVVGEQQYPVSEPIGLAGGDLLFLRTDGVDEAMSPGREVFGEDRLLELLRECRGQGAEDLLRAVEGALERHTGGASQEDDLTMMALKIQDA